MQMLIAVTVLSGAGILFAGYFSLPELASIRANGFGANGLGFPTCVYGGIVFIAVFVIAVLALRAGR
jgi:hypothetical protein